MCVLAFVFHSHMCVLAFVFHSHMCVCLHSCFIHICVCLHSCFIYICVCLHSCFIHICVCACIRVCTTQRHLIQNDTRQICVIAWHNIAQVDQEAAPRERVDRPRSTPSRPTKDPHGEVDNRGFCTSICRHHAPLGKQYAIGAWNVIHRFVPVVFSWSQVSALN